MGALQNVPPMRDVLLDIEPLDGVVPVNGSPAIAACTLLYQEPFVRIQEWLDSLDSLNGLNGGDRFVVVTDGNRQESDPRGKFLSLGYNGGWTAGINLAAKEAAKAGYSYLLATNNDVEILDASLVKGLLSAFEMHPDCAFASPTIVFGHDHELVWYQGGKLIRNTWVTMHPGIGKRYRSGLPRIRQTDFFSGCCVLICLDRFLSLGGFDQNLFMYFDEVDLSYRARKAEFGSYLVDIPMLAHDKPGCYLNAVEGYYFGRNPYILIRKHARGAKAIYAILVQLILLPIYLLRSRGFRARLRHLKGHLEGLATWFW